MPRFVPNTYTLLDGEQFTPGVVFDPPMCRHGSHGVFLLHYGDAAAVEVAPPWDDGDGYSEPALIQVDQDNDLEESAALRMAFTLVDAVRLKQMLDTARAAGEQVTL